MSAVSSADSSTAESKRKEKKKPREKKSNKNEDLSEFPQKEGEERKKKSSSSGKKKSRKDDRSMILEEEKEEEQNIDERRNWCLYNIPKRLELQDDDLCKDLLDMGTQQLQDMVEYFATEERIGDDEISSWGPAKFEYNHGDCYDWHVAMGCLNCGSPFDLRGEHINSCTDPPALVCFRCGHRPCPRHFDVEADSLVERMEGRHLKAAERKKKKSSSHFGKASDSEDEEDEEDGQKEAGGGGIYLYGMRRQHNFGQFEKCWWQNQFLSDEFRRNQMLHQLRVVRTMGKKKGATCQEECEKCGHDRAFFESFQARSADEGMTILFECCKCGARKVFNS